MRGDRTGAEVVQRRLLEAALIRGLLTNEEWGCFEPFMVAAGPSGGRLPRDHRRTLNFDNVDSKIWEVRKRFSGVRVYICQPFLWQGCEVCIDSISNAGWSRGN